jgi:hypothetical protein
MQNLLESDDDRFPRRLNLFLVTAIAVIAFIAVGWFLVHSLVETQNIQGCDAP